ncbi:hypothetical protein DDP54_06465 [Cellulomonas sp. WB94]|uniref:hypothetical protein n=1 Tax=Cellulomonas sp. WB94 TaxID=2173174 RepID=UPI000D585D8D|nr:hypothetical protein [Cellulomonas sp. WB94]PVU82711.1 hypothetical protein DDP54_06465 [Cellulomonas sp. WB94]
MSALIDLRGTYGWRLCAHARRCAAERAVPVRTVLEVVADPQITRSANDYGEGRFIYTRGDISVVVAPATRVVITVLWHTGLDPRWWTRGGFHAAVASVAA